MSYIKGPWHIGMKPGPIIYGKKGEQIADCRSILPRIERNANAKLIQSAPELIETLEAIVARISGVYNHPSLLKKGPLSVDSQHDILVWAKNAISEATGE